MPLAPGTRLNTVVPFKALNPLPKKKIECPYCGQEACDHDKLREHLDDKHRGWQERAIAELITT
jgi:hypothetical protein